MINLPINHQKTDFVGKAKTVGFAYKVESWVVYGQFDHKRR